MGRVRPGYGWKSKNVPISIKIQGICKFWRRFRIRNRFFRYFLKNRSNAEKPVILIELRYCNEIAHMRVAWGVACRFRISNQIYRYFVRLPENRCFYRNTLAFTTKFFLRTLVFRKIFLQRPSSLEFFFLEIQSLEGVWKKCFRCSFSCFFVWN